MSEIEKYINDCIEKKNLQKYYGKVTELNSNETNLTRVRVEIKFIPSDAAKGNMALNTNCLSTSFGSNYVEFYVKTMCWGDICGVLANLIF